MGLVKKAGVLTSRLMPCQVKPYNNSIRSLPALTVARLTYLLQRASLTLEGPENWRTALHLCKPHYTT